MLQTLVKPRLLCFVYLVQNKQHEDKDKIQESDLFKNQWISVFQEQKRPPISADFQSFEDILESWNNFNGSSEYSLSLQGGLVYFWMISQTFHVCVFRGYISFAWFVRKFGHERVVVSHEMSMKFEKFHNSSCDSKFPVKGVDFWTANKI